MTETRSRRATTDVGEGQAGCRLVGRGRILSSKTQYGAVVEIVPRTKVSEA